MSDSLTNDAMGLVLAGGASERFGRDKALEPVGGIPMALLVYRSLAAVIRDVRVSLARVDQRNPIPAAPVVLDDPVGCGPAGGLRAGLLAAEGRWIFAAACDMPGLDPESVGRILDERSDDFDAVLAVDPTGRVHPLAGAWHPRALPTLDSRLAGGKRSLTSLAEAVRTRRIPLPDAVLRNVNRPTDTGFL